MNIKRGGGTKPDIIIESKKGDKYILEVKATGPNNFISITGKDIVANYLIWLLYDDYFFVNEKITEDIVIQN